MFYNDTQQESHYLLSIFANTYLYNIKFMSMAIPHISGGKPEK